MTRRYLRELLYSKTLLEISENNRNETGLRGFLVCFCHRLEMKNPTPCFRVVCPSSTVYIILWVWPNGRSQPITKLVVFVSEITERRLLV